jgi:chromosome segregation ATPase
MKSRLEELKSSLIAAGIPAKDLKEILSQLNKVEEEIDSREPFQAFADNIRTAFGGIKEQIELRKEEKRIQEEINRLQALKPTDAQVAEEQVNAKDHELYNTLLDAQKHLSTLEEGTQEYAEQAALVGKIEQEVVPLTVAQRDVTEQLDEQNKKLDENQDKQKGWGKSVKNVGKSLVGFGDKLSEIGSFIGDIAGKWQSAFGLSETAKADLEAFVGVAQGAGQAISSIRQGLMTGDWLSAGMGAISGVMSIASTFGQARDKKKERQIQAEIKLVERLQKIYEDLGETIKNVYAIDTLNEATKASKENLIAQINATERMIAAEKGKKDTDWNRIDEWKEQIEEYKEMMKELEETRLQELGAFASDENKKSGAEAFLDAWMEAYKETGNGLIGLDKQFDEFFEEMVKRQLLQRGSDKFLNNFFNEFDNLIAKSAEPGADMSSTLRQIQDIST